MYVELWCEEQFNKLELGPPDFSQQESVSPLFISSVCALALVVMYSLVSNYVPSSFQLPPHVGLLVDAFTHINEPDSIYGITLANEVTLTTFICISC